MTSNVSAAAGEGERSGGRAVAGYAIHGHAIVSADDLIAGPDGATPPDLRNEVDWQRFQAALDAAAVTVLGRLGHAANENRKRRKRIVVSTSAAGLEHRRDAWWWNPAMVPLAEALTRAAPQGGIVAVPGGRTVFDFFLAAGFDEFHLARARRVRLGAGIPVFSECRAGWSADAVLARHGLAVRATEMLDPAADVTLTIWSSLDGTRADKKS